MAYTATKTLQPRIYNYPRGQDITQRFTALRGIVAENDTSTLYTPGGLGSTSFQVTAFSAVGLVTFNSMVGVPLQNGQRVVVYNTGSNTNDGTYVVSNLVFSSATAGTFTAVAIPGKSLAGSAQTSQTAEGVGQLQFGVQAPIAQTFTVTGVTVSGGIATLTYTTLVGSQLQPGDPITIAGMTNAGNNGNFTPIAVFPTSSTAGTFQINNPSAVATDSGTGTGNFQAGYGAPYAAGKNPAQCKLDSYKGYEYEYDYTNKTVRIFLTGTSANTPSNEAALGATVAFDGTITFEAYFTRTN